MIVIPSNIGAPATLTFTFLAPAFAVDLTTVTAVTLGMLRRDGTQAVLTATIVAATPSQLVCQYEFEGGEITSTGTYALQPLLAVPGGSLPVESIAMFVSTPFANMPQLETTAWLASTSIITTPGPTRSTWATPLDNDGSPYVLSVLFPWVPVDLSGGDVAATLWEALDGQCIVIADYQHEAGSGGTLTLTGAEDQLLPVGDGTFDDSVTYSTPGFVLRLKYSAALSAWLEW